jgi:hypothetical protein
MSSQISEIKSEVAFRNTLKNSKRPTTYPTLIIDTSHRPETYLNKVMDYIKK